ncbi:MAG: hypothetical protein JW395_1812 [Nitrospira sp.]|nr:hypothetical protein [Nitrospira sp.]
MAEPERSVAEVAPTEDGQTPVQKYLNAIASYDTEFKPWEARAKKILKRYRDDDRTTTNNEVAKFNILWSNVQTLIPAVYARLPKADVSRRFGDNDQVGRVASLLIERACDFEIEHYPDYRATMMACVTDRFLPGRGVAWVRYEPHVRAQELPDASVPEDGVQVTEDVEAEPVDQTAGAEEVPEEIEYECAPVDYVHWKDFGHSYARTWEEVTLVWRWVYMNKDALIERFGEEKAKTIPMDSGPTDLNGNKGKGNRQLDQAKICEVWDKERGKVFWLSKSVATFIDERDDPLSLEGFFPCGKPLYATMTSDSLVPVPDFVLYQDQARELDILSDRIDGLVKALKVRGVYDASVPALQRLMTEGDNNSLIPVDKWMAFSEKGGLKGSIDLLPLDMIAEALMQCYRARADIKGQIYEITGIADIIRGQTEASETATAQQIKGQYAGLRLRSLQEAVALFATELIRLKAQIICTKFQDETILMYAAAKQLSEDDQALIPQALALIKDRPLRNFRIEVAADSLVQIDEMQHKKESLEFIATFGGFIEKALPVGQAVPELVPMVIDLMKMGISAFKGARQIEGTLDAALDKFKLAQQQPKQPKPDLEMAKVQAETQANQMRIQADAQADQARAQADMQVEQMRAQMQLQLDQQRMAMENQAKAQEVQMDAQFERWKAQLDAATKIMVAQIGAKAQVDAGALTAADNEVVQGLNA